MKRRVLAGLMAALMVCSMVGCSVHGGTNGGTDTAAATPGSKEYPDSGNETKGESSGGAETSSGDTIKIAAFINVSGSGADAGVLNMNGAQLAIDNINEAGGIQSLGGKKLELVVGDTMSDTSQAKAVCERVMADHSIVAGIGIGGSSYTIPMMPVFEKMEKPFVQIGVSTNITNQGYTYTFQPVPNGESFGSTQVEFLQYLGESQGIEVSKVGIIYENTEYGLSTAQTNKEVAEAAGYEVVYDESFTTPSSDLSSLVVALKNSGAEAIFPVCFSQDAKLLFNTMNTMDYHPVIVGGGAGFLFPAFAQELGEDVDGIVSVGSNSWDSKSMTDNQELAEIAQQYEEKYGTFMAEHAVGYYNNIYIIAKALEECGSTDGAVLRETIANLHIPTLQPGGELNFDETGANTNARAVMIQWQKCEDGEYRPKTVYPEEEANAAYQSKE